MTLPAGHPHGRMLYIPGRAGWKLVACLVGLGLLGTGIAWLWTPLRLVVRGHRAQAVAKSVILTRPGQPDLVLTRDEEVQKAITLRDMHGVFWNVFAYTTDDGRQVEARDNVGGRGRPLHPLIDADGLPTTLPIYSDARDPQPAVFPTEMATWLAGGTLVLAGLACAIIGATLFYWAKRPVELPDLSANHRP